MNIKDFNNILSAFGANIRVYMDVDELLNEEVEHPVRCYPGGYPIHNKMTNTILTDIMLEKIQVSDMLAGQYKSWTRYEGSIYE